MEVAGLVAGVLPLVVMAKDLHLYIQHLRLNSQRSEQLTNLVKDLAKVLEDASSVSNAVSSAAVQFVESSLQDVRSTLESLAEDRRTHGVRTFVSGYIAAPGKADKLDEVEKTLKSLTTQVVVVGSIFQLKEELASRVWVDGMDPPAGCTVGLERTKYVLDFLQRSASEQLRVVGIHGQPGVGKTTILNHVWEKDSSTPPFGARSRAYIQIGHGATWQQICNLQSSILWQLGGGRVEFPSPEIGKRKLSEHFQKLKTTNKPVFLAIDNVFETENLRMLLPFTLLTDIVPAFSVIAITCRDFAVVRALLTICHLDRKNESQVLCFPPPCLDITESRAVFAACGDLDNDADADLLESLVPLCGGLPLALTVLGKLFAGNARRSREEWEPVKEQMQKLDSDDEETGPVTKALQLSYDLLTESRKAAFCDVVNFFYGWSWERVERIVGVKVLNDLKDSSLISEADDWTKCNESALKQGYKIDDDFFFRVWAFDRRPRAVTMHDLTLKFGEGLHSPLVTTKAGSRSLRDLLQRLEAPKVRNLVLRRGPNEAADSECEFVEKTTSLQTLIITEAPETSIAASSPSVVNLSRDGLQPLRFLSVSRSMSEMILTRSILEIKLSSEIREINLYNCNDIEQLPDTSMPNLEVLSIRCCENFRCFSPLSMGTWCKLKYLQVLCCDGLTSVPSELGHLENLKWVEFVGCKRLSAFPSLSNAQRLTHLRIERCPSIQILPTMSNCSFQELHLIDVSIDSLDVENVSSLEALSVAGHRPRIKYLPPAIRNASSLQSLDVRACKNLVELPDWLGKLTSLTKLDLSSHEDVERLLPAIANCSSLQILDLKRCESLVGLPSEVGKLMSLTQLSLSACINLKGLLPAIANCSSLRILDLSLCRSLVELPDEVGRLPALRELDVHGCTNLRGLPPAVENNPSLHIQRN